MEICVDSLQSAINAEEGGACRVELCACLEVGGVTPSIGLLKSVKEHIKIPVFVLIRPRSSDFLYSDTDIKVMKKDIVAAKDVGADGFVLGALDSVGNINQVLTEELINLCIPKPVTFHRAIDMCNDPIEAIDTLVKLGCQRVLTSGQQPSAYEGKEMIHQMNEKAKGCLSVMPGGGITVDNLPQIIETTGCTEFHGSASMKVDSNMTYRNPAPVTMGVCGQEFNYVLCSTDKVKKMVNIIKQFTHCQKNLNN